MGQGGATSQEDKESILRNHIKEQTELLADDDIADDDSVQERPSTLGLRSCEENGRFKMNTNLDKKVPALPPKSVNFSAPSVPQTHREMIILD